MMSGSHGYTHGVQEAAHIVGVGIANQKALHSNPFLGISNTTESGDSIQNFLEMGI
jgi:hypothetical protein